MTRILQAMLLSALLLLLTACSDKPSGRFDVWGTVKFKNQPVPAGLIVINPDFSKGNDGPQGMAEIRDGRFDTRNLDKGAPERPGHSHDRRLRRRGPGRIALRQAAVRRLQAEPRLAQTADGTKNPSAGFGGRER